MPSRALDLHARGLGHVLRDRQLEVPAYQRPYSWSDDNVLDFWSDLREALDRGDEVYFLGAIVLADGQGGRDTVIDGQQRLATGSMLIAAFRDAFLARDQSDRAAVVADRYLRFSDLLSADPEPRLRLSNQDHQFFEELVIARQAVEPDHPSHRRMLRAARSLTKLVEDDLVGRESWQERLASWVEFVDRSAQVITVEVPTQADAFLIFETLNDRGAPLTIADLLKTYLMSRAAERFDDVERGWSGAMEALGSYDETPEIADFLRHYWSSIEGSTRERDLYRSIRAELSDPQSVADFASALPSEANTYAALLDISHPYWAEEQPDLRDYMRILNDFGLTQGRPLLLAILAEFAEYERLVAMRAQVCWSVRGLIVGGIGGGRTERAFASAAVAIRSGEITDTDGLFDALRPIIASDDEFRLGFEGASLTRRRIADYLIKTIEAHRRGELELPNVAPKVDHLGFLHQVMPAHTEATGWPGFAPDDLARWVSRLGNFVLLDRPRRPRAPGWTEMREVLSGMPYDTSRSVARFDSWSPDSLAAHQRQLAAEAVEIWPRRPGR